MYILCVERVASPTYSIKRQYDKYKSNSPLIDERKKLKFLLQMKKELRSQTLALQSFISWENTVLSSFSRVSYCIARRREALADEEYIKEVLFPTWLL